MIQSILRARILATAVLNPPLLFSQLFGYDWYRDTMLGWVNDLKIPTGAKILELGCGPGNLSAHLAQLGYEVVGVDKSERMIKHALSLESKALFVEADAYDLPFEAASFDVIILASLFNLVPSRPKLLLEIHRALKPGGVVSVQFPLPIFNGEVAKKISNQRNLPPLSTAAMAVWASVGKKLNAAQIHDEFTKTGFENISTKLHLENNIASVSGTKANTNVA